MAEKTQKNPTGVGATKKNTAVLQVYGVPEHLLQEINEAFTKEDIRKLIIDMFFNKLH